MTDDHALRRAMRAQVLAGPVQTALDREPEDSLTQFAWAVRCLQEVDGIAADADEIDRGAASALSLIASISRYPAAAAYAIRAAPTETDAEARRHVLKIVRAWDETADAPGMAAAREQIGDELDRER